MKVYKDMHRQPPVLPGTNKLDNSLPWWWRQNLGKVCNTPASWPKKEEQRHTQKSSILVNRTMFPLNRHECNTWHWGWRNYDRPKGR